MAQSAVRRVERVAASSRRYGWRFVAACALFSVAAMAWTLHVSSDPGWQLALAGAFYLAVPVATLVLWRGRLRAAVVAQRGEEAALAFLAAAARTRLSLSRSFVLAAPTLVVVAGWRSSSSVMAARGRSDTTLSTGLGSVA